MDRGANQFREDGQMQYQFARALLILLITTGVAVAQTPTPQTLTPIQFTCVDPLDSAASLHLLNGSVVVEHFTLSEEKSFMTKGAFVLNLTASGTNRSNTPARVSVEAVGFDDKQSLSFAVTAQPLFSISPGKTETIKGDIYIAPGTLKRTSKICLRVNG